MELCRRTLLRGAAVAGALALPACSSGGGGAGGGEGGGAAATDVTAGTDLVALADVPVGQVRSVTGPEGSKLLVARPSEDEVVAFSAVCTHQGCTVEPEGDTLACPCHGSRFALLTGEVEQGPADAPLPRVPVQVVDGQVRTA